MRCECYKWIRDGIGKLVQGTYPDRHEGEINLPCQKQIEMGRYCGYVAISLSICGTKCFTTACNCLHYFCLHVFKMKRFCPQNIVMVLCYTEMSCSSIGIKEDAALLPGFKWNRNGGGKKICAKRHCKIGKELIARRWLWRREEFVQSHWEPVEF